MTHASIRVSYLFLAIFLLLAALISSEGRAVESHQPYVEYNIHV